MIEQADQVIRRGIRMAEVDRSVMRQVARSQSSVLPLEDLRRDHHGSQELVESITRLVAAGRIKRTTRRIGEKDVVMLELLSTLTVDQVEDQYRSVVAYGQSKLSRNAAVRKLLVVYFERQPWWSTENQVFGRRNCKRDDIRDMLDQLVLEGVIVKCDHMDPKSGKTVPHYRHSTYATDGRLPSQRTKAPAVRMSYSSGDEWERKVARVATKILEILTTAGGAMKRGYLRQGIGGGNNNNDTINRALASLTRMNAVTVADERDPVTGRWYNMIRLTENLKQGEPDAGPGAH